MGGTLPVRADAPSRAGTEASGAVSKVPTATGIQMMRVARRVRQKRRVDRLWFAIPIPGVPETAPWFMRHYCCLTWAERYAIQELT